MFLLCFRTLRTQQGVRYKSVIIIIIIKCTQNLAPSYNVPLWQYYENLRYMHFCNIIL